MRKQGQPRMCAIAALTVVGLLSSAQPSLGYQRPGDLWRVSVTSSGAQATGQCGDLIDPEPPDSKHPVISSDGRFVAFNSCADNLVPGDSNRAGDIFVHDNSNGRTEVVSVTSEGSIPPSLPVCDGQFMSAHPSISGNGRFVAFDSCAPLTTPDLNPGITAATLGRDVFVHDRKKKSTTIVSQSWDDGLPRIGNFQDPSISGNGRFVVFRGTIGIGTHLYLHDRISGRTEMIDVSSQGVEGNGLMACPADVTSDGRFVVFESPAPNLVEGDSNLMADIFMRDRLEQKTTRVSVKSDGSQAGVGAMGPIFGDGRTCEGGAPAVSENGRSVAFSAIHADLVPADRNNQKDSFVHDVQTGRTERVSVSSAGVEGTHSEQTLGLSANGRFAFFIATSDLRSEDDVCQPPHVDGSPLATGCVGDAFVHDLRTGATEWTTRTLEGKGSLPVDGALSADGTHVALESDSTELVAGDTNGARDIFVRSRGSELGLGDTPSFDVPKAFSRRGFAFVEDRQDDALHDLQVGEIIGGLLAYRPESEDVFVRLDLERLSGLGVLGPDYLINGTVVFGARFTSEAGDFELRAALVGAGGSVLPRFGLFECGSAACEEIAQLEGGFGTTGESVVAAIPTALIPRSGSIRVELYSGLGTYYTGSLSEVDSAGFN